MKTLSVKKVVSAILLLEAVIVVLLLLDLPRTKYDIENNKSGNGYTLLGAPENVSDFVNEKIMDLTFSDDEQGRITSINGISIVHSDKNLLVLKVGTSEAAENRGGADGSDIIGYEIVKRNSYELWFDFTDKTKELPAYTLMSDEDEIFYWVYFE